MLIAALGSSAALGQQGAFVSGHIQTQNGFPAAAVRLMLLAIPPQAGPLTYSALTDEAGNFRFTNVAPGQYSVFAGAVETTALAGTANATSAIVITNVRPQPLALPGSRTGTYYPGTADESRASAITVGENTTINDLNFSLALGTTSWSGPQLRLLRGRIVFEGGPESGSNLNPLALFFSDGPDNRTYNVLFRDDGRKADIPMLRLETTDGGFHKAAGDVPMPKFPDGTFRLTLPEGVYRVSQIDAPGAGSRGHPVRYYVKGLSLGSTDLSKELLTIGASTPDELIITLSKCANVEQVPLCR